MFPFYTTCAKKYTFVNIVRVVGTTDPAIIFYAMGWGYYPMLPAYTFVNIQLELQLHILCVPTYRFKAHLQCAMVTETQSDE